MYPERIDLWLRGQALTAARLNKTVQAVNYLLNISASQDSDQPSGGATNINVAPPGGDTPPTPTFTNPPSDEVTALGQPFKFLNKPVQILPPTVYGATGSTSPQTDGENYYTVINTDEVGNLTSVTVAESAPSVQLWDGENGGTLVACTGQLATSNYGEALSIDTNALCLPIIPIFQASENSSVYSLLLPKTGNSIPVRGLIAGDGAELSLSPEGAICVSGLKNVQTGVYDAASIQGTTLQLPLAAPGIPGLISNVRIDATLITQLSNGTLILNLAGYDPSDPSVLDAAGLTSKIDYDPDISSPVTRSGILYINPANSGHPGYIDSVEYNLSGGQPEITRGKIRINGATYAPSDPSATPSAGVISKIAAEYYSPPEPSEDENPPQPTIKNGEILIKIPRPANGLNSIQNETQNFGSTAAPGNDGWVQTLYLEGTYQNGSLQYQRYDRQLMRISDGTLQVVNQEYFPNAENPSWQPKLSN